MCYFRVSREDHNLQLEVPPAGWPGHKTVSLTVTPYKKSCGNEDHNHRYHKTCPAFWNLALAGVVLYQAGNASDESCFATEGSTVPCQAQSPRMRPLAGDDDDLSETRVTMYVTYKYLLKFNKIDISLVSNLHPHQGSELWHREQIYSIGLKSSPK